jgi:hypothetical protein
MNRYSGQISTTLRYHNDCAEVDELLLELADYKNDYADVAAEKLLRKCSSSWEVYEYLQDRVFDARIPDSARQQLRRIIKRIQVRLHQSREYGWAYTLDEAKSLLLFIQDQHNV